ncbi:MAG: phenylalanine--tRNA ligase beta subunit-related protein, partial [Patescibacteria group bacterium]
MKIIVSQLNQFLPKLKKSPRQLADDLTMIGHFCSAIETDGKQTVLDLEVRQNRGDCLSYYGIARDLSVFYQTPIFVPKTKASAIQNTTQLPIKVLARKETVRIMAIKISRIKNQTSPDWLKNFLKLHQINNIDLLVDLTNYITLCYGIPCHIFDTKKSGEQLTWEINNNQYSSFVTLDGTKLELKPDTFIIGDKNGAASLVMLGGQRAAIDKNTNEIIVEMAIYDRKKVRKDAKSLGVVTEAGIRLEKDLDPKLIPIAFDQLIDLIQKHCQGEVSGTIFDYYPNPEIIREISFNPKKVSDYAGI